MGWGWIRVGWVEDTYLDFLVLVEDGDAERGADVGDGLLPGQGQGPGFECRHAVHAKHPRIRTAGPVLVARVVKHDVLAVLWWFWLAW